MKILTHPAMLALGLAVLYLLVIIAPLVSPTHIAIYHLDSDIAPVVAVVVLDLASLWLLLTTLLLLARRPGRMRVVVWSTISFGMPWILLKSSAELLQWNMPHTLSRTIFCATLVALFLLWLLWKPDFLPLFEHAQRLVATMIGFVALSGLFILVQLLWFTWKARDLNQPHALHQRQLASTSHLPKKRVVWLILDELSYQQVYEKRFPGLQLPAFDQLAGQSSVFTQTMPVANWTEIVIPSLMTGLTADRTKSSASGQLMMRIAATKHWQAFDSHQTVFEDALENGFSTAVAGWYNPYCRMLAPVSDHCFWSFHGAVEPNFFANQSILENLFMPARRLLVAALNYLPRHVHADPDRKLGAQLHIEDYKEIFATADSFLADSSVDFLFLHLPVPHPEGIYDRKTAQMTISGNSSYVDNLALADRYLAHLRRVLEERGEWDSSAIVVMGDHSWRTSLAWIDKDVWTREDEIASHGGQFDDRPAYIVKLPNQQKPVRIDDRFEAIRTRALLDGIIADRIKTPEDLAAWVRQGK
jgi:Sulfatase